MQDGQPRSWQHYVYGMGQIAKRIAQEKLRTVECMNVSQSSQQQYIEWRNHHVRIAGY